jgi:hypothetical protein
LEKTFCSLTKLLNHRKSIRPSFAAALARSPKLSLCVSKNNNFETLMDDADHDDEDDALAANSPFSNYKSANRDDENG